MSRRFIAVSIAAVFAIAAFWTSPSSASASPVPVQRESIAPRVSTAPCAGMSGWNTLPDNEGSALTSNKISGFAAGRQAQGCDRLVITLQGTRSVSFRAHYGEVREDGSGNRVHVAGAYDFSLAVWAWYKGHETYWTTRDDYSVRSGRILYPTTNPNGLRRVVQVKAAGAHEGITQFAVGLNAKKPFRVFAFRNYEQGWTKVVVEFRHR